jgi:hypothetical protein
VGLISYPLYLWHWPILSFARMIHFKEPTDLVRVLCVALAFVLAHLTYRYIERPIRFGAATPRKPLLATAALAAVGCLGFAVFAGSGVPWRFPKELQTIVADTRNDPAEDARQYRCLHREGPAVFDKDCDGSSQPGTRRVLLWGDSHAAHLGPGLDHVRQREGFQLAQYSSGGCPPIAGFASPSPRLAACGTINQLALDRIAELKPDTVILAGRWEIYNGKGNFGHVRPEDIRATIERLKSLGVRNVVVMGQFPIWGAQVPQLRARNFRLAALGIGADAKAADLERNKTFLTDTVYPADDMLKRTVDGTGATFVSPLKTLCNGEGCLLVVPNSGGKPIYWDDNHLSRTGSIYFVEHNLPAIVGK